MGGGPHSAGGWRELQSGRFVGGGGGRLSRAGVLLLVVVSSCGRGAGAGDDLFFPTYPRDPDAPLPATLLEGTVAVSNRCLFAETQTETFLLLWPQGWSGRSDEGGVRVLDDSGQEVVTEGEAATFVGGERRVQVAEDLNQLDIPAECSSAKMWLVADVT